MRKLIFASAILISMLTTSCAQRQCDENISSIDLGKCNIQVTESNDIDNIRTVEGDNLVAQKGKTRLVEIKIEGTSPEKGYHFMSYNIPKLLAFTKGVPSILPAIAVAVKFKHHETGEPIEKYHNEATMLCTLEKGDNIRYYAVFEVPFESCSYQLMLPAKISNKVKINL
jgi:hypothetical protein